MTTDPGTQRIQVQELAVEIVRKPIKNLHLGVYPPDGRVRVAVPLHLDNEAVRLAVVTRLAWIRRQRQHFLAQPRQSRREMVSGESHYVAGQRYRLDVVTVDAPAGVRIRNREILELRVRPGMERDQRQAVLQRWYRQRLREAIPPLLVRWEERLGVRVAQWRIKRMKTRWGTCNITARRIWLNLELARTPPACLEYVLVHELLHLLERHHNHHFRALLDQHLPHWRTLRDELKRLPLAHDNWDD